MTEQSPTPLFVGAYPLDSRIHQSESGTLHQTSFGPEARPAIIKIRPGGTPDAQSSIARWRNAIELSHPNLLRTFDAGSSVLTGVPIVYVVMERADESLASVLAERQLTPIEARDMLVPTLSALSYLHHRGFVHAGLHPANILAVGDQLKLSADTAVPISDGPTPPDDIGALGTLLKQVLEPPQRSYPEPLATVLRHSLDPDPQKRWTADQLAATLNSLPPAPILNRNRKWIYAALASLILIVIVISLTRQPRSKAIPVPTPPIAALRSPVPQPSADRIVDPVSSRPLSRRAQGWSVVVASYRSHHPAEKRLQSMLRRWPKFQWSLLQQPASGAHYLVTIGQNLSEEQAKTLRQHAMSAGLPRDTYIKRFRQSADSEAP